MLLEDLEGVCERVPEHLEAAIEYVFQRVQIRFVYYSTRGSGWAPGRRKRGGWAYACRALVVGIGVRTAAARAECGMRAAWARVEGATLQGFEDRGTTLALSRSLSLSRSRSLSRSLACSLAISRSLARSLVLSLSLSQGRTAPSGASPYRPKTAPRREVRAQDHFHT